MLVYYEVEYYEEIEKEMVTEKGMTFGDTLAAAVSKLSEYYGTNNITSVKVTGLDDIIPIDELKEAIPE